MKFKLYKELLNENEIMSHVFLNCVDESINEIAAKNERLSDEEIENQRLMVKCAILVNSFLYFSNSMSNN